MTSLKRLSLSGNDPSPGSLSPRHLMGDAPARDTFPLKSMARKNKSKTKQGKKEDDEFRYVVCDFPGFVETEFLQTCTRFEYKNFDKDSTEPSLICDGFPMHCERIDTFGTNLIFEIPNQGAAIPIGKSNETVLCELDKNAIPQKKVQ